MLADTISGQLAAERQRDLLAEAVSDRLARGARSIRPKPAALVLFDRVRNALTVRIRPIRPEDTPLLRQGFSRLSMQSRRLRFLVAKGELTGAELRYFTDVDHHDHEALVAVTRLGGKGVAVARYIRDPRERDAAEVAVTVIDEWQSRGIGSALARRLAARARCEGIHRFTAMMLPENEGARRLLPKVGATTLVRRDRDTVEYEIALAPFAAERRAFRYAMAPGSRTYGCCA